MKKIAYLIVLFSILININACSGYKPIFGSSNLKFEIADFSIEGNKKLGNQIYSRLRNFSKSNKNQEGITSIGLVIAVSKEKNVTSKNSAGKILEYRVNLNVKVKINNYLTKNEILNKNFNSSSSYKVQDQYSETIKLESKILENLINQVSQELLINLSENILR